jgi:hypothetical protein
MAFLHPMILGKMRAAMEGRTPTIISGKTNVLKGQRSSSPEGPMSWYSINRYLHEGPMCQRQAAFPIHRLFP